MSELNGLATPESLFGKPVSRVYDNVTVEGLGTFRIRTVTAGEAAEYAAARVSKTGELSRFGIITSNARIIVLCCVTSDGDQMFSKDNIADIQNLPADLVAELAEKCLEHCGMSEAEDEAKN